MAERTPRRQMVGEAPAPAELATPAERAVVNETLLEFVPFERSALLPLLQAVQGRYGLLSKGLLGYLGERIRVPYAELYGVASFYALLNTSKVAARVRLCGGVPCILAGAERLADVLHQDTQLDWQWFACIGQCDRAPAALVGEEARYNLSAADVRDLTNGYH